MTTPPIDPFATRTETESHGLGRTVQGVLVLTGISIGLVLLVGYPVLVILGGALTLTVRSGWKRFGQGLLVGVYGDGVTHCIRVPFTDLSLETTIRKGAR